LELPGRSEFVPVVLFANAGKTIVARVAYVDGHRDVQVLDVGAEGWEYVGERGRALTGTDGNFLTDAVQGPDGRLWVLVSYSRPSNPRFGGRAFLYMYEKGKWLMADPPTGHRASGYSRGSLLFIGTNEPVQYQLIFNDKTEELGDVVASLLQWKDGDWIAHPAEELLRQRSGHLVWNDQEAWNITSRISGTTTVVEGYRLRGPKREHIAGPVTLVEIDGLHRIWHTALSGDSQIAVLTKLSTGEEDSLDRPYLGRIVDVSDSDEPVAEEFPGPPVDLADHCQWSPTGELFVTDSGIYCVSIFALRKGQWVSVAEVTQEADLGYMFAPRLFFRTDGVPILTWEDFIPID
jgi:hypothetical protein